MPLASDDSCKLYCMTTTQGLKKHAKKFGIEGVAETAAELGFSVDELADLIEWLDEEEYTQLKSVAKQFTPDKKRHRKTYEQRAKDLLGITDPEEEAENAD